MCSFSVRVSLRRTITQSRTANCRLRRQRAFISSIRLVHGISVRSSIAGAHARMFLLPTHTRKIVLEATRCDFLCKERCIGSQALFHHPGICLARTERRLYFFSELITSAAISFHDFSMAGGVLFFLGVFVRRFFSPRGGGR